MVRASKIAADPASAADPGHDSGSGPYFVAVTAGTSRRKPGVAEGGLTIVCQNLCLNAVSRHNNRRHREWVTMIEKKFTNVAFVTLDFAGT